MAKFLMANGGGRFDWVEIDVVDISLFVDKTDETSKFLLDCDGKLRFV